MKTFLIDRMRLWILPSVGSLNIIMWVVSSLVLQRPCKRVRAGVGLPRSNLRDGHGDKGCALLSELLGIK